jgi:hypothetical protein
MQPGQPRREADIPPGSAEITFRVDANLGIELASKPWPT